MRHKESDRLSPPVIINKQQTLTGFGAQNQNRELRAGQEWIIACRFARTRRNFGFGGGEVDARGDHAYIGDRLVFKLAAIDALAAIRTHLSHRLRQCQNARD